MLSSAIVTAVVRKPKVEVGGEGEDMIRLVARCQAALVWEGRSIKFIRKFAEECHDAGAEDEIMAVCDEYCELVWN